MGLQHCNFVNIVNIVNIVNFVNFVNFVITNQYPTSQWNLDAIARLGWAFNRVKRNKSTLKLWVRVCVMEVVSSNLLIVYHWTSHLLYRSILRNENMCIQRGLSQNRSLTWFSCGQLITVFQIWLIHALHFCIISIHEIDTFTYTLQFKRNNLT